MATRLHMKKTSLVAALNSIRGIVESVEEDRLAIVYNRDGCWEAFTPGEVGCLCNTFQEAVDHLEDWFAERGSARVHKYDRFSLGVS